MLRKQRSEQMCAVKIYKEDKFKRTTKGDFCTFYSNTMFPLHIVLLLSRPRAEMSQCHQTTLLSLIAHLFISTSSTLCLWKSFSLSLKICFMSSRVLYPSSVAKVFRTWKQNPYQQEPKKVTATPKQNSYHFLYTSLMNVTEEFITYLNVEKEKKIVTL